MKQKPFKRQRRLSSRRLLSGVLSLAMLASLCTTALAGEDIVTDTEDTSSSSSQSTYATLTAEALMFNLTVPTTMPRASRFLSAWIVQVKLLLARTSTLKMIV